MPAVLGGAPLGNATPYHAVGVAAVVVADQEAAEPTYGICEGQSRRRGVVHGGHGQLARADLEVIGEDAADEAAVPYEAAAAEQFAHRVGNQRVPVQREVVELGTENTADGYPGEHVPAEFLRQAVAPKLFADQPGGADEGQEHHHAEAGDDEVAYPDDVRVQ
jgi:hypothetical protein